MTALVHAIEGGTLVDRAMRRVRDHIREHDLKVGDTLPGEGQFASDLGVSRAVMREAFGALAALKLIDVGNGRRARVGAIDGSVMGTSLDHAVSTSQVSVNQVWEVRRTLELRTAQLAAQHRSDAEADEIAAAARAMAEADLDLDRVTHHDIRLHQAIARACGNALFHQIVRAFEPLMRIAVPTAWRTRTTPAERLAVFDNHRALADAIGRADPAAAEQAMLAHFEPAIGELFV